MDGLDASIRSVLEAASIDEEALTTLNREDLKDLFPGSENFLQRKRLWDFITQLESPIDQIANTSTRSSNTSGSDSSTSDHVPPCQPQSSTPLSAISKTIKLPDPPEYVVYTDSELDMVRCQYFSLLRAGNVEGFNMSKELICRLVRNTITSMLAILRASPMGNEAKYPSKLEMRAMSQKIVEYYPMLRDPDPHMSYVTVYAKMYKRLQNVRSPRKRQGSIPQRGKAKKTLFDSDNTDNGTEDDTSGEITGSNDSTVLLESPDDLSEDSQSSEKVIPPKRSCSVIPSSSAPGSSPRFVTATQTSPDDANAKQDSLKMQARHYNTLSNMYKKPNAKPNPSDVAQVLNLEFKARRAFIDADVTREDDRPKKIFEAYPCFKEIGHAMDELSRIVGGTNQKFIGEMKARWSTFCSKVQFFGIYKKALKPPLPLDVRGVDFIVTLFNVLPSLFPSPALPPKRLGNAGRALLHILKPHEDPALYLEKRPLSSPVLLFDGTTCIVAVGNIPVSNLPKEDFSDGMLVLMAYYYTLHLTYPKCLATVLSVIQTEVIRDVIHERDATSAYKKALAEWKSFFEK